MASISQHHYPMACATGRWTLASTIIASSMAFIDGTALNVILPSLQSDLDASAIDLFWVLNSYLMMLAALIIVGGSLGDKKGRVKIFQLGILVFTIGSALCGLSQDIVQLIIFRTIQGIGGALMIPGSLAIISATFSPEEKGKAIGVWSSVTTIVTICGPVIGGALADIGLWRAIFYINVPLGILSVIVLQVKVPESKEEGAETIDWMGAGLLVLSLAFLTFSFLQMPEWSINHPFIWISLLLGTVLFGLFIVVENKKREQAMVPFTLFKNKTFLGVNLLSFFLYAGLGGMMLFLSLYLIQIQGYSQLQAGLTFLPFSILMISFARLAGSMTDKFGARNFLIVGPTLAGIGMLLLASIGKTEGPSEYWTTFFPGFLVFAFGMSITVVPLTTAVMSAADESKSGIASGINNSITRIAATFMNAIVGAIAIFLFANYVVLQVQDLPISGDEYAAIILESSKLGEAKSPDLLDSDLYQKVSLVYENGFISVYRIVGFLSASLAFLSACIAVFMLSPKKRAND